MKSISQWIFNVKKELKLNTSFKSKFVILLFRVSSLKNTKYNKYFLFLFSFVSIFYYFLVDFFMGVEIKPNTRIGWGFVIYHPNSIVINPNAIIGRNFVLRHGVTIGNKFNREKNIESGSPIIGDNVEIGANSTIIGHINVGMNVKIGANTFVDFDLPSDKIVLPQRSLYVDLKK